jgi:flavin-dependent dehydrogenase
VLAGSHRVSYGTVSAWGSESLTHTDFLFNLQGEGLLLDRAQFDRALRCSAEEAGAEVRTLRLRSLDDGQVSCRFVIDAGGRSAMLSRRLGAIRRQTDRLIAFHMCLSSDCESDQLGSLLVESVDAGWWYTALLPSRRRLVVFLTDADLADRLALLNAAGFFSLLKQTLHIGPLIELHGYEPATDVRGTDASSGRLDCAAGDHWLAVGDAAQSFDPLSSKGIANALYTGVHGARAVAAALRGDSEAMIRYDRHLSEIFRVYCGHATDVYRQELRWRDSVFWQRRQQPQAGDAARGPAASNVSTNA